MPDVTYTAKSVSDLTVTDIANYLRISELSSEDNDLLTTILEAAKSFVYKYTGLTATEVDNYKDITIAVLVLCQDMYDTRAYYVDSSNVNKVVDAILGLHSVNLL